MNFANVPLEDRAERVDSDSEASRSSSSRSDGFITGTCPTAQEKFPLDSRHGSQHDLLLPLMPAALVNQRRQRGHVDTCGAHFPRLMSDAAPLLIPVASMVSESFTVWSLGRMSRRNSSGS